MMMRMPDKFAIDIRTFMTIALLFSALVGVGLYSMYTTTISSLDYSRKLTERTHNDMTSKTISMSLKTLFKDLQLVASHVEVQTFLTDQSDLARGKIEQEFLSLCKISKAYDQVRLFDLKGMELVRVNDNAGHPASVPQEELQDKSDRYYYREAMKLAHGEIYVSPFDLNIENGAIEQPLKPMIRVCMGVFNDQGQRMGIAVLNYYGQSLLNSIIGNKTNGQMQTMLLNKNGYWLLAQNKSLEWTFMYEEKQSISFAAAYPKAWAKIQISLQGQFSTPDGDYTFSTVTATPATAARENACQRQWKVICFTPMSTILAAKRPIMFHFLGIFGGILTIILFGAMTRAKFVLSQQLSHKRLEIARREAVDANKAKSDFLARMSHEIRTPMNAVIGLTHLALRTDLSPKQTDYLNKIYSSAQSLLAIINDILDFSKIEAGQLAIDKIDFLLDDVLNNTVNMVALQAEQKGIEFLLLVRSSVPNQLIGDPLRLGQILLNLTGNAIKFTDSGEVILSAKVVEKADCHVSILFCVKDSGIGIEQEQIDNLFQPFSQADSSITRRFGGTGLGLVISKRLVEKMGGTMQLKSEPGKGSEFSFTIPFELQARHANTRQVYPDSIRGMRVLIVDDSKVSRLVLSNIFESFSFNVITASGGEQALQLIQEHDVTNPFRLVVTDWRMPDMDGLELTQKIKKNSFLNNPPKIIMLTAYGHEAVRFQAEQADLDGFMLKPFNRSILFDTITDIFGKNEIRKRESNIPKSKAGLPPNISGARVLLVEDNKINQQVAKEILESADIYVSVADNGQMALEMLESGTYDVVLMDIQMPVMDGFQAAKAIRADPRLKEIPVIAMTAHALVGDKEKSLLSGMNDHITKPIDPDLLLEVLSNWLPNGTNTHAGCPQGDIKNEQRKSDIPDLPGINVRTALARVMGNEMLYQKLLHNFVAECETMLPQINTSIAKEDHEKARHELHSLKGVAGNIGAEALHQILQQMETILKNGEDIPRQLMDTLDTERIKVCEGITRSCPRPADVPHRHRPIGVENIEQLRPKFKELAVRLEQHDIEAKKLFRDLQPMMETMDPQFTVEFAARMEEFNFAASRAMLKMFSLKHGLSKGNNE